jgi:thiamine pyrophosphokinase
MPKPTRAVIFLNGDLSDLSRIKKYIAADTLLIGCDGGTRHILEFGLKPDVIIGDFDSFKASEIPPGLKPKLVSYPTNKDFTDSEAAIRYAAETGCRDIILAGTLGSRLDHMLGNIFLLNKDEFAKLKIKIIEGGQEAYIVRGKARINGKTGDTISFIPIAGNPTVRTTDGLKYDLNRYTLSLQGNTGISNVLTRQTVNITVTKGAILVIHQLGGV